VGKENRKNKTSALTWLGSLVLSVKYVFKDVLRRQRSFFVGVATVFIVVFFVSFLQNAIQKSPIVFFKLSEDSVGSGDLLLTPTTRKGQPTLVNDTFVSQAIGPRSDVVWGSAPRWFSLAQASNRDDPSRSISLFVIVLDNEAEKEIGIARQWKKRTLGEGETHVSSSVLREVGLVPNFGNRLVLNLDIGFLLSKLNSSLGVSTDNSSTEGIVKALLKGYGLDVNSSLYLNLTQLNEQFNIPEAINTFFPAFNTTPADIYRFVGLDNLNFTLTFNASSLIQQPSGSQGIFPSTVSLADILGALGQNSSGATGQVDLRNVTRALGLDNVRVGPIELLRALGVSDSQMVQVNGSELWTQASGRVQLVPISGEALFNILFPIARRLLNISLEYTVVDAVDSPDAKWSGAVFGNVAVVESSFFARAIDGFLTQALLTVDPTNTSLAIVEMPLNIQIYNFLHDQLQRLTLKQVAFLDIVQLRSRMTTYIKDSKGIDADMIKFTDAVALAIGINYPATFTLPIVTAISATIFIRLFLNQIFNAVTAVLFFLGAILIYALLVSDVEQKTYEYGMLRALGLKHYVLIELLTFQSLTYAIPGVALGLLVCFVVNVPVMNLLSALAGYPAPYTIDRAALIYALVLGFSMPLIANIGPIRRALAKNLRDSLDVYHQVFNEVSVKMIKLAEMGVESWQIVSAILLIIIGLIVYYLIPYSFTFGDFDLFFTLLIFILLGMVVGLSLLCLSIQPFGERLVLFCMLWFNERRFLIILKKNLAAHRRRSIKTAMMFTVSVSFIVFSGAMFTLQTNSLADNLKALYGADITIVSNGWDSPLNETSLTSFLDRELAKGSSSLIASYTWLTFSLDSNPGIDSTYISNLPGSPSLSTTLVGVQANYLDATYSQFYLPNEIQQGRSYRRTAEGQDDAIYSIVRDPTLVISSDVPPSTGSGRKKTSSGGIRNTQQSYGEIIDALVMEGLRLDLALDTQTVFQFEVQPVSSKLFTAKYLSRARAMVRKVPGFFLSSYRSFRSSSTTLISDSQWFEMLLDFQFQDKGLNQTVARAAYPLQRPPKARLLIKANGGASRTDIINNLKPLVPSDQVRTYVRNASTPCSPLYHPQVCMPCHEMRLAA